MSESERYDRQLKLWKDIINNLSTTSRMALREALGVEGVDQVELQLLRESATAVRS